MSLRLRPLSFALVLAGLSAQAHASDLMQAYELARQNDPQFAAAEANKNAQGEGVVQSRAALLPQVSGTYSYNRRNSDSDGSQAFGSVVQPPTVSESESTSRSYGIDVQQAVYDHSAYTRLGASKARASKADFDFDAASDALIVRVADAYFNVLTSIETLASARAEERSVKRQFDQAEKRLEVGLAPITDVHESRARYDSARANAIAAANTLDDAYEALAEITGQRVENLRGLAKDFQPSNDDTRGVEEWVSMALDTNPTLKAYQRSLEAAEKDVQTARAGHYPTLYAGANWGKSWSDGGTTVLQPIFNDSSFDNSNRSNSWGLTLSVPIFSGFATQSRVRQALYQRDAAADQLEQQKRAITRSTRGAYRSLVAGQAEVEARRQAVVSAQAAYEAGEAGLEVGTRTIVDVLITQQALYNAQREFARARHAYLVNKLKLRQSAGILEVSDLENVNRALVADANAALESTEAK
jgi:outer membrane protein